METIGRTAYVECGCGRRFFPGDLPAVCCLKSVRDPDAAFATVTRESVRAHDVGLWLSNGNRVVVGMDENERTTVWCNGKRLDGEDVDPETDQSALDALTGADPSVIRAAREKVFARHLKHACSHPSDCVDPELSR